MQFAIPVVLARRSRTFSATLGLEHTFSVHCFTRLDLFGAQLVQIGGPFWKTYAARQQTALKGNAFIDVDLSVFKVAATVQVVPGSRSVDATGSEHDNFLYICRVCRILCCSFGRRNTKPKQYEYDL